MKYLFGNMSFSLNCDDITNTALKKRIEDKLKFNFNAFEASDKDKHDVEFYFCDNFKDSNLIKYKDQDIEFGFCFQDCFKVYFICNNSNRGLFDIKFFSSAYVNHFEGLLIKFYHRVFLFFVLMVQSNKKFSLIHGASISYHDNGFLFVGPSGAGKTKMLLNILELNGASFVADDFSILDNNRLYCNGSYMVIKKYHQSWMSANKTKTDMPFLQRLQWKLFNKDLKFRVSPKKVFNSISKSVDLKGVFLLAKGDDFKVSKINVDQIVDFILKDFFSEFSSCMNVYQELGHNDFMPSLSQVVNNIELLYRNNFKNINSYKMELPKKYNSNQLISFLNKSKCLV